MAPKKIHIRSVDSNFEREPLARPFGFKGGFQSETWQTIAYLKSASGIDVVGLCSQSILWCDPTVFVAHSEAAGNALMYAMLEHALRQVEGRSFAHPMELFDSVFESTLQFGRVATGNPDLRKTFALNALVALDNAAWLLYARENGINDFDRMIPAEYRPVLSQRHTKVASAPAVGYGMPIEEVVGWIDRGYFFPKIKLGSPGDPKQMLKGDKARVKAIHEAVGNKRTRGTPDGKIAYYFDCNGRYQSKDDLREFIDYIHKIGAADRICFIEEPFGEFSTETVGDLGIRIIADETVETVQDVARKADLGYGAIALKPIAKTFGQTLRIAKAAHEHGIPCFCADLCVNPILVDWNKNVAARLDPLPGIDFGLMENNGHQNYRDWERMKKYHPYAGAAWTEAVDGFFHLDDDFYKNSGGIFEPADHYTDLFRRRSS